MIQTDKIDRCEELTLESVIIDNSLINEGENSDQNYIIEEQISPYKKARQESFCYKYCYCSSNKDEDECFDSIFWYWYWYCLSSSSNPNASEDNYCCNLTCDDCILCCCAVLFCYRDN